MFSKSKIVFVCLSALMFILNAGLYNVYNVQEKFVDKGNLNGGSQHFLFSDYFLFSNFNFGLKNKTIPDKFGKILQKIKYWNDNYNFYFINGDQHNNFSVLLPNPIFITDLFSPPDICFPFNSFW